MLKMKWPNQGAVQNVKRLLTLLACCVLGDIVLGVEPSTNRPASWAQLIRLEGVPNLHQIDTNLYRSAQPTAHGMQNLKQKGVTTVVSLRSKQI